jgi:uncharacterized pyridoxal phosphate-containing UPF0001 family protein
VLADAGIGLVGENRVEQLIAKQAVALDRFTWDFIGHLQSRKVKSVLPHVRMIHSVGSDSVIADLARRTAGAGVSAPQVLIEVNVSGEPGKSGIAPEALHEVLARCRDEAGVDVRGLMTMPPLAGSGEENRRWFAALAQLAADEGVAELSMGTTQDFVVAVEEGATLVRIGTRLYR